MLRGTGKNYERRALAKILHVCFAVLARECSPKSKYSTKQTETIFMCCCPHFYKIRRLLGKTSTCRLAALRGRPKDILWLSGRRTAPAPPASSMPTPSNEGTVISSYSDGNGNDTSGSAECCQSTLGER